MSAAHTRYGRRGGGWLPKDYIPGDWRADLDRIRARADRWPAPDADRVLDPDAVEGRARMALARMRAGIELDDFDRHALRCYPEPSSCFFRDDDAVEAELMELRA